jgi:AcrR family transcriptional regulator
LLNTISNELFPKHMVARSLLNAFSNEGLFQKMIPMPTSPSDKKPRRSPRIYTNRRGVLRRDELFEILQCSIASDGWKDLTLRQIARGAGVSVGLLHHHFASRDDIARSFYEEVCANLFRHLESRVRAPFAVVFRDFIEFSLDEHEFIGCAYADAARLALRTGKPLPCLARVFSMLVRQSVDFDPFRAPTWLLSVVHQRLIERFLFGEARAVVLASAERLAPHLLSIASHAAAAAELSEMSTDVELPATQLAGTDWHDNEVRRSLKLGLPSRNPRRIRDARRRSGEGL